MKSIQSLIEPKQKAAPTTREQDRAARALKLAKDFLSDLLQTEFFDGPCGEGQSLRRQRIIKDSFRYFIFSNPAMKGVVGRRTYPHILDFIERFFKYEVNNNKKMSLLDLTKTLETYQGANQ